MGPSINDITRNKQIFLMLTHTHTHTHTTPPSRVTNHHKKSDPLKYDMRIWQLYVIIVCIQGDAALCYCRRKRNKKEELESLNWYKIILKIFVTS